MKKLTKIMILVLAASMLVALLIPMVGSAAASDPLAAGKAYTMGDYLKDYLSSPVWKKDAVGMADRTETGSFGQVLGTTGPNFTKDVAAYDYAWEVNEPGATDIYSGHQSTTYWRTSPKTNGYFVVLTSANKDKIIEAGGVVWEFDLYVEDLQTAGADTPDDASDDAFTPGLTTRGVDFDFFTTDGAAGGHCSGKFAMKNDGNGKIGFYAAGSTVAATHFDTKQWVHVTFAFTAADNMMYVYLGNAENRTLATSGNLGGHYPYHVRIQHPTGGNTGTYRIDNILTYGGTAVRDPGYLANLDENERFVKFVDATLDTSIQTAIRFDAFTAASTLLEVAKASTDPAVVEAVANYEEFAASTGMEELRDAAKIANAAEYKKLAQKAYDLSVDTSARSLSNIAAREAALKVANDYYASLNGMIAENEDNSSATAMIAEATSKVEIDKKAVAFITAMDKFYLNYTYGFVNSMTTYLATADEIYASLPGADAYLASDAKTAAFQKALNDYNGAGEFLQKLNYEANSNRICQIMDLLDEGKENWGTDAKYKRMWNAAYEILVLNKNYDPEYGDIAEAEYRFFEEGGPHDYFWGEIQKEHVAILKAKLDAFNAEGATYIEKAGICTFVDYYMADNEQFIDATNSEVFELVAIAKGYSEQLGTLREDYKLLLVQNSQKFVNTVNLMLECKTYAEIKALHDEAKDYYYAMDIPDEVTMEAVLAYEAMEDTLADIETDCIVFVDVAGKLSLVANDDELYAQLVKGYGCYENLDESYEGVTEAKAVYSEQYDAYSAKVDAMNEEVMEMTDIVSSVRSFCGLGDLIDFVRNLFN